MTDQEGKTIPAKLENSYIEADGQRLFYRHSGATKSVPPVVLVHGFVISSRYMVPVGERLARHFRVYAPDLPGFGKSQTELPPLDIPALAYWLIRWMDAMGLEKAAFLGNSLGCQIIAELALRHPSRLERAILVGPTVEPSARSPWQMIARLLRDGLHEHPKLWALQVLDYFNAGLPRALATSHFGLSDRIESRLPHIEAPVLVVRGSKDRTLSHEWARRVAELLPRGRLVTVPDAAHAINYSHADALLEVILPFLNEAPIPGVP